VRDSNLLSPTRNWIVKLARSLGVLLVKLAIAVCAATLLWFRLCSPFCRSTERHCSAYRARSAAVVFTPKEMSPLV
jgi:hypothetical protein